MNWTTKQEEAIRSRNENLLVSAAAGSGKTAVLVERIIRLIIEENIAIDEVLVVTFTNAAASEMKMKITKAIKKKIESSPGDSMLLQKQLNNMYKSSISTFHSFALNLIRKYFYVIDVNPNISIVDETQSVIMKNKAIDLVFEERFESENPDFAEFLKAYSSVKSDREIKKKIVGLYDKLQSTVEPEIWLSKNVEAYNWNLEELKNSKAMEVIVDSISNDLKIAREKFDLAKALVEDAGCVKFAEKLRLELEEIENAIELFSVENFDKFMSQAKKIAFVRATLTKDEKENYSDIKELVKNYRDQGKEIFKDIYTKYGSITLDESLMELNEVYPFAKELKTIILEFSERYKAMKLEKNLLDFADIEHYAINILKDKKVAQEVRDKYKYIFIDEYQDSNYVQEEIIQSIKQEDNLFMVGDIKQSIYRFRLAEPKLFQGKYEKYKKEIEQDTEECHKNNVIDLNQNFRSKKNIIEFINDLFTNLMPYDDNQALHQGVKNDAEYDFPVELLVCDNQDDENIAISEDEQSEIDEILSDLKKEEIEATMVSNRINKLIGTTFYDYKEKVEKQLTYKDIIVLLRGNALGEVYYNILMENGIPAFVNNSTGYFDTIEILTILDLLRIIDNGKQDIPLLGVLKSKIFGFSIEELIEIRKIKLDSTFENSLLEYEENGLDSKLKLKIKDFRNTIKKWREECKFSNIDDFVWYILIESGYYKFVASLPNGKQRQLNLRAFLDKTVAYRSTGDNSIYGLLGYFEDMKNQVSVGQMSVVTEDDDSVQITTIHKSKGLEFPVVFVSGLNGRFHTEKIEKIGDFHSDIGLSLTYVNADENWFSNTIIQKAINSQKKKENREEEIRILYVALTRAQDRLILTANVDDINEINEKIELDNIKPSSYFNIIYPYLKNPKIEKKVYHKIVPQNQIRKADKKNILPKLEEFISKNKTLKKEIEEKLQYKYKYRNALGTKSKFSVSELNKTKKYNNININTLSISSNEEVLTGARRGTIHHKVLEKIDFQQCFEGGEDYLENVIKSMEEKNILTKLEAKSIIKKKILNFVNSDIGSRARNAGAVKEKAFTMKYTINEEEVLVQGIIDCYFEENGKIVIIDYKSNRNTRNIEEEYIEQLKLYKEALEKGLNKEVSEVWLYLLSEDRSIKVI